MQYWGTVIRSKTTSLFNVLVLIRCQHCSPSKGQSILITFFSTKKPKLNKGQKESKAARDPTSTHLSKETQERFKSNNESMWIDPLRASQQKRAALLTAFFAHAKKELKDSRNLKESMRVVNLYIIATFSSTSARDSALAKLTKARFNFINSKDKTPFNAKPYGSLDKAHNLV